MTTSESWAAHWALDPPVIFPNHGSFGACPTAVLDAQHRLRQELEAEPVRFLSRELDGRLDAARAGLAAFVGAEADDLAFVPNATTGVNAVVRSLSFAAGDELLATDHTYNACRNALEFVAGRAGARVVIAPVPFPLDSPDRVIGAVMDRVTPRTRLVLVDHVTSPTGRILPVARLIAELTARGVDTLVGPALQRGRALRAPRQGARDPARVLTGLLPCRADLAGQRHFLSRSVWAPLPDSMGCHPGLARYQGPDASDHCMVKYAETCWRGAWRIFTVQAGLAPPGRSASFLLSPRPARRLRHSRGDMALTGGVLMGVDVGATTMSAGLVAPDGQVLSVIQAPTYRDGPGTVLDTLLGIVGELLSRASRKSVDVGGIGIGLPGVVDTEIGMLRNGVHLLPDLSGILLAERVHAETGIPAFVDNDVNALALAESTWGHGRGARSLALLAVGTGVGGAIILDGRLVRGRSGYGGEFGHVPIAFDGKRCICGAQGCLCMYVCGYEIALEARRRVGDVPGSTLVVCAGGDASTITSRMVFEAAAAGDALSRAIIDEVTRALAAGLGGIVNGINPEVIIVTGGVAGSLMPLQDEILRRIGDYAFADALADTRVHFVAGDKNHTVRGGAALVLYERATRAASPSPR